MKHLGLPLKSASLSQSATAELIGGYDWSGSPIGTPDRWTERFRTLLALVLNAKVAMVLLWGREGIMLYNDAYAAFCGSRHPGLLGCPVREAWPEAASFNDHVMITGFAGRSLSFKDHPFILDRGGTSKETWIDLDYQPVFDDAGIVLGIIATVVETTERVIAEQRLKAERKNLVNMFEQAPGIMAMLQGPDHTYVLANAAHRSLIGKEDVIGKTVREVHPELEGQGFFELMDRVYATGEPYRAHAVAVRLARVSGAPLEERILNFIYQPMRTENDAVSGIFVEGFDVTEEHRETQRRISAEKILSERERELRLLADALPVLVSYMDQDLRYQFVNKAYEEWFKKPAEEIQGKLVREIVGEAAFANAKPYFDRALAGERVRFEPTMPYPQGTRHIRVDYVPRLNDKQEVIGIYALVDDITAAKKVEFAIRESEAKARQSEERLRLASEAAGLGAYEIDVKSGLVHWSSGLRLLTGFDGDAKPLSSIFELVHPEDRARIQAEAAQHLQRLGPYEMEFRIVRPDGSSGWFLDRGETSGPLDPVTGRVARTMGTVIDITERKRSEERIRLLMREVNHRSKNLLAVVQAVAKQTANSSDPVAFSARFGQRLQGLAASHDLLVHNGWEGVDLAELVKSQLSHLGDMLDRRISIAGPRLTVTPTAAQTLGMALHELATNATKYGALSGDKGRVDINWDVERSDGGGVFSMAWVERAGPVVKPPERRGFGTTLLKTMTEMAFSGKVSNTYKPEGLHWSLEAPEAQIIQESGAVAGDDVSYQP
jgi:PAS domain S-box-containing protein